MQVDYRCPNCNSTETRYRATMGSHICQRCGHVWARQAVKTGGFRNIHNLRMTLIITPIIALLGFVWIIANGPGPVSLTMVLGSMVVFGLAMYHLVQANKEMDKLETIKAIQNTEEADLVTESIVQEDGSVVPVSDTANLCPNDDCGYELSEDEEFCSRCGTPRARPLAPNQVLVCGQCGRELKDDTKFCGGCGTQVFQR